MGGLMYCDQCGAALNANDKFCSKCGTSVPPAVGGPREETTLPQPGEKAAKESFVDPQWSNSARGADKPLRWGAMFGTAFLIVIIIMVLGSSSSLTKNPDSIAHEVIWAEQVKTSEQINQKELEERKRCDLIGQIAEAVMERRQEGVSMSKMMGVPYKAGDALVESLVIAAYDSPRFHTKEMQERSVQEFRDRAYLQCAKEKFER
jgi:hypothetical protein